MKIGHSTDKPLPPGLAQAADAKSASASVPPAGAHGTHAAHANDKAPAVADSSATVALSSTASTLLAGGTPAEFDAAKVARIGEAIANGTFTIDAGAIADKLIANAQELLTKVSR